MKAEIVISAWVGLLLSGCGAPSSDNPVDQDVVVTAPYGSYDFKQARTYSAPNEIPVTKTSNTESEPVQSALTPDLQNAILAAVNQNMEMYGYRRVTKPEEGKPDVSLEISALGTTQTDTYYSSWSSTWGGYYAPWYGASFAVGWAPVAVPYVSTAQYGALLINMTNPNAPDPATQTIPTLWSGAVAGLVTGTAPGASAQQRIVEGINQAFAQSTYLKNGTKP